MSANERNPKSIIHPLPADKRSSVRAGSQASKIENIVPESQSNTVTKKKKGGGAVCGQTELDWNPGSASYCLHKCKICLRNISIP